MKKFTLFLLALMALAFTAKAQQFVSTEPANKNVILEEFTGRNCGYCPDGHLIANQIMANNPGRVWAINVHAGSYAPTSYPNFNTTVSSTILSGFSVSGFPSGVVNRSTAAAQGRGSWSGLANAELNQAAVCNVAGKVMINPETRVASITVEVYYTDNSGYDQNYLTVAMLQDSIMGTQSGMTSNPAQVVNGTYCHMHVLRDIVQPSAWGEAISPTTQGTLVTKTYEYQIPEIIGSPNGVEVNLDHIFFLAWVSERFQGTPTRPILNACELESVFMTDEPIYPAMSAVAQEESASCSLVKDFGFSITNIGTETLTSIKFNAQVADVAQEFEWTGELASGGNAKIDFEMEIPYGSYTGTLSIIEANGMPYSGSTSFAANSAEWAEVAVSGETTTLKVYIIQDQWGEQTTWDIINSAGETVASGGPYQHLPGAGSTSVNVSTIDVPSNECYLFRIYDNNGNGICCNYGNGYYYIKDETGTKIFEGDGDFGDMASHMFSINGPATTQVITEDPRELDDDKATFVGVLVGNAEEVGFEYKKLTDPTVYTVTAELGGDNVFVETVFDLVPNLMYSVKAYAIVNGEKIYGESKDFHTLPMGVGEEGGSLKVYPNPTSSILNIEGQSMTGVSIYNALGQCVISEKVNGSKVQVNTSSLNNGVYFVRIHAKDGSILNHTFTVAR